MYMFFVHFFKSSDCWIKFGIYTHIFGIVTNFLLIPCAMLAINMHWWRHHKGLFDPYEPVLVFLNFVNALNLIILVYRIIWFIP